ncbi:hypothetical protein HMPREF0043_01002 [Actinobaculum sp. oral taxon 183 str. F0552]|nr:hypothetical protein HMPREF0043_01002 [Actinobaculum sp. oral taxon 183 str. F0552]
MKAGPDSKGLVGGAATAVSARLDHLAVSHSRALRRRRCRERPANECTHP